MDAIQPEMSLLAMAGQQSPNSIRITSIYHEHRLHVLIDSGSTHNFIQERAAQKLHLTIIPCKPFNVMVGNGESICYNKQCKGVKSKLQQIDCVCDLYGLQMKGSDIVLGFQWLKTLGPILTDYKRLSMKFSWQGRSVELLGEPIPTTEPIQLHQLRRLNSCDAIASIFFLKVDFIEENSTASADSILEEIMELLT
ncbi:RVP_2 domain-containing protein [Cephalotus follicularis]|uniref:RVP_2 domain-containing protein n=1 Tax=Cephalotus follicularis TaxID=3775 RepID=A0A1Q3B6P1_CEPFO|nr:RVP_2 domain-containing protein [Cephalotus follicularis]